MSAGGFVLKGQLHRVRRGKSVAFITQPLAKPSSDRRPAKVAKMLALAHHLQRAIERGIAHDRADVARRLGLTRARVTQLLDLLLLAPDIQEQLLSLTTAGDEPVTEKAARALVASSSWAAQRKAAAALVAGGTR